MGTHMFSLPPGDYEVAVSYPWIIKECGRSSVKFSLAAGQTKRSLLRSIDPFIPGQSCDMTSTAPNARLERTRAAFRP